MTQHLKQWKSIFGFLALKKADLKDWILFWSHASTSVPPAPDGMDGYEETCSLGTKRGSGQRETEAAEAHKAPAASSEPGAVDHHRLLQGEGLVPAGCI